MHVVYLTLAVPNFISGLLYSLGFQFWKDLFLVTSVGLVLMAIVVRYVLIHIGFAADLIGFLFTAAGSFAFAFVAFAIGFLLLFYKSPNSNRSGGRST